MVASTQPLDTPIRDWSYRPHLDGLRAIAVLVVVLFHSGGVGFDGGFIGVSVFFVLSGFLVTGILLAEAQSQHTIHLRRFYARRVRRLLPAAMVALAAIALGAIVLTGPFESAAVLRDARSAAVYLANWHFIAEATDYFGSEITASPVLHFWSLSIEEQFYLVWPLVLIGALALHRRWRMVSLRGIGVAIAIVAAISASAAIVVGDGDLMRAYYGTDLRAYQLLAGASLAIHVAHRPPKKRRGAPGIASLGVLGLILLAMSAIDAPALLRDLLASVATLVFIHASESGDGSVSKALSGALPVYLGKISYGIYLWHWPIALLLIRIGVPSNVRWIVVALAATVIAAVSYHVLENPIRRSNFLKRHQSGSVAVGLAASGLLALGLTALMWAQAAGDVDWQSAAEDTSDQVRCFEVDPEECRLVKGQGEHVMIVGDSYGAHWIPALLQAAKTHDLSASAATLGNCPWVSGVTIDLQGEDYSRCSEFVSDLLDRVIPHLNPDLILLISADLERRPVVVDGETVKPGSPVHLDAMATGARRTVDHLVSAGVDVAIVEMIPVAGGVIIPECLSSAENPADCDFSDGTPQLAVEQALAEAYSGNPSVQVMDLDDVVCARYPKCQAVTRTGIVTRADAGHITTTYAKTLAEPLLDRIEQQFDLTTH